jgi:hypothetical protein
MDSPTEIKTILLSGLEEIDKRLWVNPDPDWRTDMGNRSPQEFSSAWREHASFQSIMLSFTGYVIFILQRKLPRQSPLRVSTAARDRIHREFWKLSPPVTPTSDEIVQDLSEYMEATHAFLPRTAVKDEWQVVRSRRRIFQRHQQEEEDDLEGLADTDKEDEIDSDVVE